MSSASSSKGKVEIKFEHKNIPLCNSLRLLLIKESKKMENLTREFKSFKAKLSHMVSEGEGVDKAKESALEDKLVTIGRGVELWDLLGAEILAHNAKLLDACKQDLGKCQEMLDAGELIRIKLDSMVKGARTEKAAVVALLNAVEGTE